MTPTSIILDQLSIGYATRRGQKVVASGLNARIAPGQLTCLLGSNGVGKSTLLRTLSAFQPRLAGRVAFLSEGSDEGEQAVSASAAAGSSAQGVPIDRLSDKQLSRMISVVLTEKPDVRNMTVAELVGLGRSPYTGFWGSLTTEDHEVVVESLRLVGISGLSRRRVDTLSDGERQKTMIAKALAQQTPIIFLDEPTAFLDFTSKVEVMLLLRRLARTMQKTIFLSTHDVELALQVADVLWVMQQGTLAVGTPRQLADDATLSRFLEREGIAFDRQRLTIRVEESR